MRPKTSQKKLGLNKKTVINLNNETMKKVQGGTFSYPFGTCDCTFPCSKVDDSICRC